MFKIDDWDKIAKYCCFGAAGVFALYWYFMSPSTLGEFFRGVTSSIGITTGIFFIFGKWAWKWVWKVCPKLNDWVFPDLNGRWQGVVTSNWPIVQKLLPEYEEENNTALSEHPITIDIKQTMFSIHLTMNADDNYSSSETIMVVPNKDKQSGTITLYELYQARVLTPKQNDSEGSRGAGVLTYRKDTDQGELIEGHYWTDRNWRDGLNTAGSLRVSRP